MNSRLAFLLAAAIVAAPAMAGTASAADKVRVRLNWMYYGSHAGFAYGKDKGIYDKEGIDLDIRSGNGSGSAHRLVANKDSDFDYGSCASMVNLVSQGAPLVSVGVIDAMGTDAILVRPDTGVKTIADLKSARGDLGVQSGLIATNAQELVALKRLGERNYFEFKLGKSKAPQRVGDITLLLRKTDPKKNKYTVDVMADDKLTEKKDKNVNEPVQFYSSKARQPYEIVVNQVQKDLIVGYLATPKEQAAR